MGKAELPLAEAAPYLPYFAENISVFISISGSLFLFHSLTFLSLIFFSLYIFLFFLPISLYERAASFLFLWTYFPVIEKKIDITFCSFSNHVLLWFFSKVFLISFLSCFFNLPLFQSVSLTMQHTASFYSVFLRLLSFHFSPNFIFCFFFLCFLLLRHSPIYFSGLCLPSSSFPYPVAPI